MTVSLRQIRRRQWLLAALIAVLAVTVIGVLVWLMETPIPATTVKEPVHNTTIESLSHRLNPQEAWVERMENDSKQVQAQVKALENLMLESIKQQNIKDQQIEDLQTELQAHSESTGLSPLTHDNLPGLSPADALGMPINDNSGAIVAPGIRKVVLNLSANSQQARAKVLKTVDNTIPAGAYARAVLMGGVDASTSINAQGDPRPVLLRVIDAGNLPRGFKSDLKACHVLASCYGDLSSERVYMRLEKLTCTEPLTGEVIETQVAGYITGEDGRAGVRASVVDRAGEVIRSSLVGGFFSGLSGFLGAEQQKSVFPVSPFGQTNALSAKQLLSAGVSQGAGNAMEKYAEFFIKRAEQLQPVLQVAAGRQVDIVFTQGTAIGDSSVKQALQKIRSESRREVVEDLQAQPDDKNWLPPLSGAQQ